MSTRFLILFFLVIFWQLKSQTLSTVFIDTVKIIVDNKIIYESNTTTLKFVPNNADCNLILYKDSIYKFVIKLGHLKSKNLDYLSYAGENFYINDSICSSSGSQYSESETCSEIDIHHISLKNWSYNNPNLPEKFKIRLCYRLCQLAPMDTSNYLYNYREDLWIGPYRKAEKVIVNYKNDKKHGLATAYYNDGVTFNVNFTNGIAETYGRESFRNYKSRNKLKSSYVLPNIIIKSCN
jgi:hypothetical protein